jgi:osmotically-inducible protein OsmY
MGKTKDVREAVEAELSFDPLVAATDITVKNLNGEVALNVTVPDGVEATAKNGNITLTGTVSYGTQRAAAELTVAALTGVRNVKDDIQIVNDADLIDVTVNVQDALDRYALIPDDSDVVVDTDGNTVTLSGHVRTWAEHDAAVDAAWMASGVYDVRDDLYITSFRHHIRLTPAGEWVGSPGPAFVRRGAEGACCRGADPGRRRPATSFYAERTVVPAAQARALRVPWFTGDIAGDTVTRADIAFAEVCWRGAIEMYRRAASGQVDIGPMSARHGKHGGLPWPG